jgi:hypothetical protein
LSKPSLFYPIARLEKDFQDRETLMRILTFRIWGVLACLAAGLLAACSEQVHIFEGVEGPLTSTPVMAAIEAAPSQFDQGDSSRLAVFLTEDESNWLSLVRGLKTIGIPFRVTTDLEAALDHDTVMVYPQITGLNLDVQELTAIRQYVQDGGTLIGTNILGGGLSDMFGFKDISESKARYAINFKTGFSETAAFQSKGLSGLKIGSAGDAAANPGTNSYLGVNNPPLATYGNGAAAIIENTYGDGKTYALGVDLGQLLAKGYNRRQVDITEHYANHYQPTLDAFLILIENIYMARQHPSVTLGTVPDGKALSFILSHDVDFSKSLKNALPYAEHQHEEAISATYFIQTKYVRDYNDVIFMDDEAIGVIQELERLGAEIASHSVAHSNAMWDFDMGDGAESYPQYKPFVMNAARTRGATLMGELRVSKFLLDNFTSDQPVESFRPGFLSNPSQMPQALASSGYKYSSSVTANVSLTHLPFRLTYGREFSALTPVFEIPITVEDELDGPMIDRLGQSINLARQIAEIGGVYVVLTHTDDVDSRLDFQKAMVEEVRPYAWMGSIRQFGDWWAARDQVTVDIKPLNGDGFEISLTAPSPIEGLSLDLNGEYEVTGSSMPIGSIQIDGQTILLGRLNGAHTVALRAKL